MAPRGQTLPQAATESAREARKSFFCELCQKGYARMNDFEAHEASYDHSHRKRLKDMKQLTKDPNAATKARESERKANEEAGLKSINLSLSGASGPTTKKKPVFKSILQPQNVPTVGQQSAPDKDVSMNDVADEAWLDDYNDDPTQMKANGWAEERYDPRTLAAECSQCRGACSGHDVLDLTEPFDDYTNRSRLELEAWGKRLAEMA